jgi:hypothetical protein
MEWSWNRVDKGRTEGSENLSQCHFFLHKLHVNCLDVNQGLHGEKLASGDLICGTAQPNNVIKLNYAV